MDVDKIRELIALMKENDLTEIRIIDGETRLWLKRGVPGERLPAPGAGPAISPAGRWVPAAAGTVPPPEEAHLLAIESPMVGTFYRSPAPDVDPYVRVGDRVTAETVVCIVEAMKVMNEIKAEVAGTIEKILVENGNPVEFGQPMFMVKPD